jgi:hypothetical protein
MASSAARDVGFPLRRYLGGPDTDWYIPLRPTRRYLRVPYVIPLISRLVDRGEEQALDAMVDLPITRL